jgi:hypothetical protein
MKIPFFFAALLLLASCNPVAESETVAEKPFFDLKGFLETEIEKHNGKTVEKTVIVDDQTETQTLENFDFKSALAAFIECDINKPSFFDKYDTTAEPHTHTARAKDLKVQTMRIVRNADNSVAKIEIEQLSDTPIYTADKLLVYEPDKGFFIKNNQKMPFADKKYYEIKVLFKF